MNISSRLSSRAWLLIPLCAAGFLVWTDYARVRRVQDVSGIDREEAAVDPGSPTGYVGGRRWLIVPEHNSRSYQWIAETQQMLALGQWRVRRVDDENAPFGREVHSASPYHWWLAFIAWCDHRVSGRPLGLSVERAALFADPALHLLLLIGCTLVVARRHGAVPAALLALGFVAMYPLGAAFLPGVPDERGMVLICAFGSVLPLVSGIARAAKGRFRPSGPQRDAPVSEQKSGDRHSFLLAGVAGGVGLWISASSELPILGGIALGAAAAAWAIRGRPQSSPGGASTAVPWRVWALGGATTSLVAYLVEYGPAHLDLRLQVNHPLYGLAWIGVGEVLARWWTPPEQTKHRRNLRCAAALTLAVMATAALPAAMVLTKTRTVIAGDPLAIRLTSLPNGIVAPNLMAWIARDGLSAAVGATCLPVLMLGLALRSFVRSKSDSGRRAALVVALGPAVVLLALACCQLRWWNLFDVMLLTLVVTAMAPADRAVRPRRGRWLEAGIVGLALAAGLTQLVPPAAASGKNEFTKLEVEGLIERALAHWIAAHAGPSGAVVLAPPDRTVSLCFYGGLRGLGTPNWENRDGLAATNRIVTATTADEAQALLGERGVTHLIIPSWDSDLDEFARWTLRRPEDSFINALHRWQLPTWLRPLPYPLPAIAGFEGQSVVIFEVTDEGNRAAALGRLAEYFVEMEELDLAMSASLALQRYPADLGALVAIAQVAKARADAPGFTKTFNELVPILSGGFDRTLPWDRRVSLAIVLAEGERADLAREQVRRCLTALDEARIRSLTTASLFRLLVLSKAFAIEIPDERLRVLARQLLPAELRQRL